MRTFTKSTWEKGKAQYVKQHSLAMQLDKTSRDSVIAEDPSTFRLVTLNIAHPSQFRTATVRNMVKDVEKMLVSPTVRREYKLISVNDEAISPKVGDGLVLLWHSIVPSAANRFSTASKTVLIDKVRSDPFERDNLMLRDVKNGSFLAAVFTHWKDVKSRAVNGWDKEFADRRTAPKKREIFRIIAAHIE
jgi:hypothetical protein